MMADSKIYAWTGPEIAKPAKMINFIIPPKFESRSKNVTTYLSD
jgi:hypothetical protein